MFCSPDILGYDPMLGALTPGIIGTWLEKVELEYASSANLSVSIFNFAS
jgi:hypothetical protein